MGPLPSWGEILGLATAASACLVDQVVGLELRLLQIDTVADHFPRSLFNASLALASLFPGLDGPSQAVELRSHDGTRLERVVKSTEEGGLSDGCGDRGLGRGLVVGRHSSELEAWVICEVFAIGAAVRIRFSC